MSAKETAAPVLPSYEHQRAIMEGARNAAADDYFKARHDSLDTIHNRRIFEAGFQRGYEAKPAAPAARACNAHDDLVKAAQKVLDGLNARIHHASEQGHPVPVFTGIADLHDALSKAGAA